MDYLKSIIDRVNRNGSICDQQTPTPLLTIEEFFDGNDVTGSIGCNLEGQPHPSKFRAVLEGIRNRSDVYDVRVQVTEMDDPQWPFSDTAWVITTASADGILAAFPDTLRPDETWEGFVTGNVYEAVEIPDGHTAIACWWD